MKYLSLREVCVKNGFPERIVGKSVIYKNVEELIIRAEIKDDTIIGSGKKFSLVITLATSVVAISELSCAQASPLLKVSINPETLLFKEQPGFLIA